MITPARVIGIDPGSDVSGICSIEDTTILHASNTPNTEVFDKIKELCGGLSATIVIEDIFPYFSMRMTPQIIDTCKLIGELTYRFNTCGRVQSVHLVARSSVKKWIFDSCPEVVLPRIEKKMITTDRRMVSKGGKGLRRLDGEMRAASFNYVDDRTVIAALKHLYGIPTPKPGKSNIYGLKDHSWQALACAAWYNSVGK